MFGNMNRAVPSVIKPVVSASDVLPMANAEPSNNPMNPRRSSVAGAAGFGLA